MTLASSHHFCQRMFGAPLYTEVVPRSAVGRVSRLDIFQFLAAGNTLEWSQKQLLEDSISIGATLFFLGQPEVECLHFSRVRIFHYHGSDGPFQGGVRGQRPRKNAVILTA